MLLFLASAAWSRQMLSPLAKKGYGARRKAGDMVRGAAVLWRRGTWKDGRGLCPPGKMERCRSSAWSWRTSEGSDVPRPDAYFNSLGAVWCRSASREVRGAARGRVPRFGQLLTHGHLMDVGAETDGPGFTLGSVETAAGAVG